MLSKNTTIYNRDYRITYFFIQNFKSCFLMNNFHKTMTFSPTAQQSKLNFKWLLAFSLIFLLSRSSNSLLAQPITFTFDRSDHTKGIITKTMSGITMTIDNVKPGGAIFFGDDNMGIEIVNPIFGGGVFTNFDFKRVHSCK